MDGADVRISGGGDDGGHPHIAASHPPRLPPSSIDPGLMLVSVHAAPLTLSKQLPRFNTRDPKTAGGSVLPVPGGSSNRYPI